MQNAPTDERKAAVDEEPEKEQRGDEPPNEPDIEPQQEWHPDNDGETVEE